MKTFFTKTSSLVAGLAFGLLCCAGPILTVAAPGGAPANDLCTNAQAIACGDALAGTTVGGTEQAIDGDAGIGVWYTFTGNGGDIVLSTCGAASFDTEIHVLTSPDCSTFTQVARNDDATGCTGNTSELTFTSTAGETYYVYVSHYFSGSTTTGTFTLSMTCPPPANDLCGDAIALSCGETFNGSNTNATTTDEPICGISGFNYPGTWFSFVGDGSDYNIALSSVGNDSYLTIVEDCSGTNCLATNDDGGPGLNSLISGFTTTIGVTYYIYVQQLSSVGMDNFELSLSSSACTPPANDLCTNATPITCGGALAGSTEFGTEQAIDGDAGIGVWYTFTGNGGDIVLSTCGAADFDTEIHVLTSPDCSTFTQVARNDDATGCTGNTSELTFTSTAGETYYAYVSYYASGSSTTGTFTLSMSCPPPANDLCADAIALECGETFNGSNTNATTTDEPICGISGFNYPGTWFSFVGDGSDYNIALSSVGNDSYLTIVEDCSGTNCLATNDDGGSGLNSLISGFTTTIGVTYYIYVQQLSSVGMDNFEVSIASAACEPPSNDLCADAISVACGDVVTGTNAFATEQIASSGAGVWYSFIGNGQDVTFSTCSTVDDPANLYDTEITLLTGDCSGPQTQIDQDDDGCGDIFGPSTLTAYTTPGTEYFVFVGAWQAGDDDRGPFELSVTCACPTIEAGTLNADATPVCLNGGTATISATEGTAPTVPSGYEVAYVLTDGDSPDLDILDANLPPAAQSSFNVSGGGNYIIHTLVFNPADGTTILAETTGVGVAGLITDGTICAALDLTGASVSVESAAESAWSSAQVAGTLDVDFTDASLNTPTSWLWDLGDGNTSTMQNPTHTYAVDGTYAVCLTVTNACGTDSSCASVVVAPLPPANNECAGAIPLTPGATCSPTSGTLADATESGETLCTSSTFANDVWYSFEASATSHIVAVDGSDDIDGVIEVFEGACGSLTILGDGCIDNGFSAGVDEEATITGLTIGTVYYVRYYDWSSDGIEVADPTFDICVYDVPAPPANDLCSNATPISCGDVVAGTNVGATEQTVTTFNGFSVGAGVWYTFTGTGGEVTLSTCDDADFDTEINVITSADCIDYTNNVAGNDDATGCADNTSEVTFTTTVGETYYVYVSDYASGGSAFGTFNLTLTCDPVTGINETLEEGLSVYPNPSNGEFVVEISGVEADAQLVVLDMTGRVVYTEGAVLNGNFRKSLNLDVASGTYLLQVATEEGLVTRKIQIH